MSTPLRGLRGLRGLASARSLSARPSTSTSIPLIRPFPTTFQLRPQGSSRFSLYSTSSHRLTNHLRPLSYQQRLLETSNVVLRLPPSRSFTSAPIRRSQSHSPTTSTRYRSTRRNSTTSASSSRQGSRPDPEPEPTSAYGKFKRMSKKYGWYAVAVYLALTVVDFSLTLAVVHGVGAERIEPAFDALMHQYRKARYGEEEALKMEEDAKRAEALKTEEEEKEMEGLSPEERKKKQSSTWGSKTFWAEVVLAYTIHKTLLLPVRAGLTVAWTPKLVSWLAARGWVGKGGLGRAAEHAQGRFKTASRKVRARATRVNRSPHRVDHKH